MYRLTLYAGLVVAGLLLAGCGGEETPQVDGTDDLAEGTSTGCLDTSWWTTSDAQFFDDCKSLATGSVEDRSTFAWLLFARINAQQAVDGGSYSAWELWASDPETFPASGTPTWPTAARTELVFTESFKSDESEVLPFVNRNRTSFDYIAGRSLYVKADVQAILGDPNDQVDFPVGAIETKSAWVPITASNADSLYQFGSSGHGLTALHIMAKIATGADVETEPSWFWTTFEYVNNDGWAETNAFVTYRDALPAERADSLLRVAGLTADHWASYRLDGTQIGFVTPDTPVPGAPPVAAGTAVILGSSILEDFAIEPFNQSPRTEWTGFQASCHACHYTAAGDADSLAGSFPTSPYPTGTTTLPPGYSTVDFVWSINDNAR